MPSQRGTLAEGILVDLARRGFLRARDARSGSPSRRKPALVDLSELQRPAGRSQPSFVSACSLRNLPVLNQLYGDALGDLAMDVLRAVVEEVLAESDPGARVARAHGPEVLIRHGSTSRDELAAVARRLRDVAAAVALPAGSTSVPLRPVVATVELAASSAWSADDIQRTLHEALTLASRSEEGFILRGPEESEQTLRLLRSRDARLARVTEALARGEVEVHFQPVIDLKGGQLRDVEALARIRAPEGLLVAGEFIDVVHDLGETAALDSHVMRRVGEDAHRLVLATARLFVNVSPLSLASPAFREIMAATIAKLRDQGLQLVLVLELTEQALLEHIEIVREIHRVHGVSFAVDDFGTGYSSLRTVCDLAVSRVISYLKIDGSLIRRMAESAEAYKVVLAVAHLARSLDLRVIAEHVETPEILERLRTTGIECGQGFLFDPALPVEDFLGRYAGRQRQSDAPPRPDLSVLEPYLHRAFAAFYDVMLSDPHFAQYFRDESQVKALVEKQQRMFVESLADDAAGLKKRYAELGRRHVELGIPLATFLKGADLLHEQLLEVLAHTTREPFVPLQTGRFFAALRNHMARGYLEMRLPEARLELSGLRAWTGAAAALDDAGRAALFACLETILDAVEARLAGRPPVATGGDEACPAARWLDATRVAAAHRQIHTDAASLDFFQSRDEDAAVFPVLEGLLGRFQRILVALR
jgi:EAL domain-containing protein (putative c-di-GMP-specific phosphodiesterase class I)/GGDEF domain-containing protein